MLRIPFQIESRFLELSKTDARSVALLKMKTECKNAYKK
jgi:hypothetical protein